MNENTKECIEMEAILYLNVSKFITIHTKEMLFYITAEEHWLMPKPQYDTHTMSMMLIEILHEQKIINDATYRKIHMKYKK